MQKWPAQLRSARRSVGLDLPELSGKAGIPANTIKAYELGRRMPSRARLAALLDALELDRRVCNQIMIDAGYAPSGRTSPSRFMSFEEATAAIRARPWPALVMSETIEMHAANDLALALWGFDTGRLDDPVMRNVLSMAAESTLAERCLNWEEAVGGIIAVFKGHRRGMESLEDPSAYFAAILDQVNRGRPELVKRFVNLWERTPPAAPDKVSWVYPVVWRVPRVGTMRFTCVVSSVNEVDSLDIDDWVPADSASHRNLERLRDTT